MDEALFKAFEKFGVDRASLEEFDLYQMASGIKNYIDSGDEQGIKDIKELFLSEPDFNEFIQYITDQDFIIEDILSPKK